MSRSNPIDAAANPSKRWFQWEGGEDGGFVSYYEKPEREGEKGRNIRCDGFTFVLLDQLGTIKGWHDASDSAIYSNEIRDSKQEALVVKSFKGGELASGFYGQIRDRVVAMGGGYAASLYIATKIDGKLEIANLTIKGIALNGWIDFVKQCPTKTVDGKPVKAIYTDAIKVLSYEEGKKGRIVYRKPIFGLVPLSPESNAAAIEMDKELQAFITSYLARSRVEAAAPPAHAPAPAPAPAVPQQSYNGRPRDEPPPPMEEEEIPW